MSIWCVLGEQRPQNPSLEVLFDIVSSQIYEQDEIVIVILI